MNNVLYDNTIDNTIDNSGDLERCAKREQREPNERRQVHCR